MYVCLFYVGWRCSVAAAQAPSRIARFINKFIAL